MIADTYILAGLMFLAAALYTSVGHAGASGYLAAMALMGLPQAVMKPTALTLNILVALLATARWTRNGKDLAWRSLLPLVAASVPAAYIGGAYPLSDQTYRKLVGVVLLVAAIRFIWKPQSETTTDQQTEARVPWVAGLATGAVVGLLSGLTGTGGGIFLTPMLLAFGWAAAKQASGLSAPFILLNSVAGLAGSYTTLQNVPADLPIFIAAALGGALLGTQFGVNWATSQTLQRLLGVVLLIAAAKFLFS